MPEAAVLTEFPKVGQKVVSGDVSVKPPYNPNELKSLCLSAVRLAAFEDLSDARKHTFSATIKAIRAANDRSRRNYITKEALDILAGAIPSGEKVERSDVTPIQQTILGTWWILAAARPRLMTMDNVPVAACRVFGIWKNLEEIAPGLMKDIMEEKGEHVPRPAPARMVINNSKGLVSSIWNRAKSETPIEPLPPWGDLGLKKPAPSS